MLAQPIRRAAPIATVGALFIAAVMIAALHGHTTIAVLLALNGVLITCYIIRHRMRTRLIYDRHRQVPDSRREQQLTSRPYHRK